MIRLLVVLAIALGFAISSFGADSCLIEDSDLKVFVPAKNNDQIHWMRIRVRNFESVWRNSKERVLNFRLDRGEQRLMYEMGGAGSFDSGVGAHSALTVDSAVDEKSTCQISFTRTNVESHFDVEMKCHELFPPRPSSESVVAWKSKKIKDKLTLSISNLNCKIKN
jgi:hypothetical protein